RRGAPDAARRGAAARLQGAHPGLEHAQPREGHARARREGAGTPPPARSRRPRRAPLSAADRGVRRARHHPGRGALGEISRTVEPLGRSRVQGLRLLGCFWFGLHVIAMRHVARRLICALIVALAAANTPAWAQVGYDRPGGDYQSTPLRSGDPATCAARCERDARCRAWAFSYPMTENPNAICWLKSKVTPRVATTCCVSGVRGAGVIEPYSGPTEYSIDRPGGDYRNFELPADP